LEKIEVDPKNQYYKSIDGALYDFNVTKLIQYPLNKEGPFTLPASVTTIFKYALVGCYKISWIDVGENSEYFESQKGVLFNKGATELIRYPCLKEDDTDYVIPDSVTSIGYTSFEHSKYLTSVIFGKKVKSIDIRAFSVCSKLSYVEFPNSLKSIGNLAFLSTNLTSVVIPGSVNSIGNGVFNTCENLESVAYLGKHDPGENAWNVFSGSEKLSSICVSSYYNSTSFCRETNLVGLSECGLSSSSLFFSSSSEPSSESSSKSSSGSSSKSSSGSTSKSSSGSSSRSSSSSSRPTSSASSIIVSFAPIMMLVVISISCLFF